MFSSLIPGAVIHNQGIDAYNQHPGRENEARFIDPFGGKQETKGQDVGDEGQPTRHQLGPVPHCTDSGHVHARHSQCEISVDLVHQDQAKGQDIR